MKRVLLGICLLAATACLKNSPTAPSPIDEQIVLAPGEQASVDGVTLRFEGVLGDSRCPADALCVLGGDAIVKVRVTSGSGAPADVELHTGDMKPVTRGDVTIALVQLAPYPFSAHPIDPKDYRVTLRVTR